MISRENIIKKFENECNYKLTVIQGLLEEKDSELIKMHSECYIENIDSVSVFLATNITETEEQYDRVLTIANEYIQRIRELAD